MKQDQVKQMMDGMAGRAFRNACFVAMQFTIFRYLLCHQTDRLDGPEKAQRHRELCSFYTGVFTGKDPETAAWQHQDVYDAIHRRTQARLTDHLVQKIAFDPNGGGDLEQNARDFFAIFHKVALGVAADYPDTCTCKPI